MQVHACVDQHRKDDRRDHRTVKREVKEGRDEAAAQSAALKKQIDAFELKWEAQAGVLRKAVGVGEDGQRLHKPILAMGQLELFGKISGVVMGLFFLVKVGDTLWPALKAGALAIWHLALKG